MFQIRSARRRACAILLLLFGAVALAQTDGGPGRVIMGGNVRLRSGITIRFKSVLVSRSGGNFGEGGISGTGDSTLQRYMTDNRTGARFGYDLEIKPGGGPNAYIATFGGTLARQKTPEPQIVHDGDVISLDLMVSPDGSQRLTDYIEIIAHDLVPQAAKTVAPPRDFTLDDGPLKFDTERITVWEHGQQIENGVGFTGKPGATFWIAFPGKGRYVLSLTPHEQFVRAGAIRDNVISFADGGQEYEVRLMSPIAGAGKAWNLYMFHDTDYVSGAGNEGFIAVGTDRLENLVKKVRQK